MKKFLLILLSIILLCGLVLGACSKNSESRRQLKKITIDFTSIDNLTDLLKQDVTLEDIKFSKYTIEQIDDFEDVIFYQLNGEKNVLFCIDSDDDKLCGIDVQLSFIFPQFVGKNIDELPFEIEFSDMGGGNYTGHYMINGLNCYILTASPDNLLADDWVLIEENLE
jgi:hypothetical protein